MNLKKPSGFTLIELMIVVAIIGLLAAIAMPSYLEQVRKTRRADANGVLGQAAQFMERFYTENSRYDQDRGGTAISLPYSKSPIDGSKSYYTISLPAVTQTTYTLRAVPTGDQASYRCGTLTLDQTGTKGSALSVDKCW